MADSAKKDIIPKKYEEQINFSPHLVDDAKYKVKLANEQRDREIFVETETPLVNHEKSILDHHQR